MLPNVTLRFDHFELNPVLGTISESGSPLRLQPQPFKLLVYLATQAGRLVTRAEIREHLWGTDTHVDFEANLNFCIRQVRLALGDDPENPRFIKTYPKRGYRFLLPVEIATPEEQLDLRQLSSVQPAPDLVSKTGLGKSQTPSILVTIALVAATIWLFRPQPPKQHEKAVQNAVARVRTTLPSQAYDAYLKGVYEWHQRTAGWKRGCEYFRQATQSDPAYAPAYAALSNCYRLLVGYNALPVKEGYAKADQAAQRAVLLDPNSADAHTALASNLLYIDWNWQAAHAEFKRALRLNPDDAETHIEYGRFLRLMGDFEGAIREGRRSVELDPLSNLARLSLCATYSSANELDLAADECNRSTKLQPDSENAYIFLSQILARQHKYDLSRMATIKALQLEGKPALAQKFSTAFRKVGYERAEAKLAQAMREEYRDPKAYETQLLFMQLDKKDSAIAFLNESYAAHDALLISIKSDPIFTFLHGDPKFEALLSKMHFDRY